MLGGVECHCHTFFNNLDHCTGQESFRARTVKPETLKGTSGPTAYSKICGTPLGNLELKNLLPPWRWHRAWRPSGAMNYRKIRLYPSILHRILLEEEGTIIGSTFLPGFPRLDNLQSFARSKQHEDQGLISTGL